jgi:hypothetical protein
MKTIEMLMKNLYVEFRQQTWSTKEHKITKGKGLLFYEE